MGLATGKQNPISPSSDTDKAMTAGEVTCWLERLNEEINDLKASLVSGDESLDALEERINPVLSSSAGSNEGEDGTPATEDPTAPLACDLKDMCMALAEPRERYSRQVDRIQELERRAELK